jgi:hypothetical protein
MVNKVGAYKDFNKNLSIDNWYNNYHLAKYILKEKITDTNTLPLTAGMYLIKPLVLNLDVINF